MRYCSKHFMFTSLALLGTAIAVGRYAAARDQEKPAPPSSAAPSDQPEFKLPPGWTAEDMQKCIAAGMPGEMHQRLTKDVGEWEGKSTMWMAPGMEPMVSDFKSDVTSIMDGRYIRVQHTGEMPGMGAYHGEGTYGYDNVKKKFVSTWIDSQGTAIMYGTGELADGGKTINWKFEYTCPLTDKPVVMREIEKNPDPNTKTLEMYAPDPKTGKEYKMMTLELKRKARTADAR